MDSKYIPLEGEPGLTSSSFASSFTSFFAPSVLVEKLNVLCLGAGLAPLGWVKNLLTTTKDVSNCNTHTYTPQIKSPASSPPPIPTLPSGQATPTAKGQPNYPP